MISTRTCADCNRRIFSTSSKCCKIIIGRYKLVVVVEAITVAISAIYTIEVNNTALITAIAVKLEAKIIIMLGKVVGFRVTKNNLIATTSVEGIIVCDGVATILILVCPDCLCIYDSSTRRTVISNSVIFARVHGNQLTFPINITILSVFANLTNANVHITAVAHTVCAKVHTFIFNINMSVFNMIILVTAFFAVAVYLNAVFATVAKKHVCFNQLVDFAGKFLRVAVNLHTVHINGCFSILNNGTSTFKICTVFLLYLKSTVNTGFNGNLIFLCITYKGILCSLKLTRIKVRIFRTSVCTAVNAL